MKGNANKVIAFCGYRHLSCTTVEKNNLTHGFQFTARRNFSTTRLDVKILIPHHYYSNQTAPLIPYLTALSDIITSAYLYFRG